MKESTTEIGQRGEALAAQFLEEAGYRILERNYRFMKSEIDLVCYQPMTDYSAGGEIVFVEVKARWGEAFGAGFEAVSADKERHLRTAAEAYLYETKLEGALNRFDVISINLQPDPPVIEHYKDVFR